MPRSAALCSIVIVSLLLTPGGADEGPREWVRAADGKSLTARLVGFDDAGGKVTLHLVNGKTVVLDAAVLSEPDRTYLREHVERRAAAVEASKQGRIETFVPESGGGHQVHIYRPPGYVDGDAANASRPAAFLYSPGGRSVDIVNVMKSAADELGWVLVGIDAYRNTGSLEELYDERMAHTKAAFAAATERVVFDPKKIVFGGLSGGGWWSYQSAAEVAPEAAGVISFGGWMGNMYEKRYPRKMAVAMVNGDKDAGANSIESPDGQFLDRRASADVKIFHFPGGHVLAPPEKASEAARWIHATKKF